MSSEIDNFLFINNKLNTEQSSKFLIESYVYLILILEENKPHKKYLKNNTEYTLCIYNILKQILSKIYDKTNLKLIRFPNENNIKDYASWLNLIKYEKQISLDTILLILVVIHSKFITGNSLLPNKEYLDNTFWKEANIHSLMLNLRMNKDLKKLFVLNSKTEVESIRDLNTDVLKYKKWLLKKIIFNNNLFKYDNHTLNDLEYLKHHSHSTIYSLLFVVYSYSKSFCIIPGLYDKLHSVMKLYVADKIVN
jgi:hypothetical protein